MSSRRVRSRSERASSEQPPRTTDDPSPSRVQNEEHDVVDESRDTSSRSDSHEAETGREVSVSQELVTSAVLEALPNPDVIRKIVAAVSPPSSGDGQGASSLAAAADGESFTIIAVLA